MAESSIVFRRKEFEALMGVLLRDVQEVAQEEFLAALAKTKGEMTGELKDSFKRSVLQMAEDLTGWVQFSFGKYGRFRDLKYVEYKGGFVKPELTGKKYDMANGYPEESFPEIVKAMQKFIGKHGLGSFKSIPGYAGNTVVPTTNRAIARLAFTFAISKMKKRRVRNVQTQFYAKGLGDIIKTLRPIITEKIVGMLLNGHYSRTWS
jgi:hypothetical protein